MDDIDREKVIERLKKIVNDIVDGYILEPKYAVHCVNDTLALLKEQEPIKPFVSINGQYFCGGCRGYLCSTGKESGVRYCGYCGRSVKWNG